MCNGARNRNVSASNQHFNNRQLSYTPVSISLAPRGTPVERQTFTWAEQSSSKDGWGKYLRMFWIDRNDESRVAALSVAQHATRNWRLCICSIAPATVVQNEGGEKEEEEELQLQSRQVLVVAKCSNMASLNLQNHHHHGYSVTSNATTRITATRTLRQRVEGPIQHQLLAGCWAIGTW